MKTMISLLLALMTAVFCVTAASAGEGPNDRVRRLALHLKRHYNYRDFNDYGAIAYGKVYEAENGLINVYYSDANENLKVDVDDSLHIVDESGNTVVSFVDQGLDGINDDEDRVGEVNGVGAVIDSPDDHGLNKRYLSLVETLLERR
jgi:hypothetical protein